MILWQLAAVLLVMCIPVRFAATVLPVVLMLYRLCAGMLYRLFGRNLDSGLPAHYTDEHWSQVVAHLHLKPQQVSGPHAAAVEAGAGSAAATASRAVAAGDRTRF